MKLAVTAFAAVALALTVSRASAEVSAYEWVFQSGANNVLDSNAGSCNTVVGCYDRQGDECSRPTGQICDLQIVPRGRCSYGSTACVWPHGAGHCLLPPGVPCLTDAYVSTGTLGNGPSTMCEGGLDCIIHIRRKS